MWLLLVSIARALLVSLDQTSSVPPHSFVVSVAVPIVWQDPTFLPRETRYTLPAEPGTVIRLHDVVLSSDLDDSSLDRTAFLFVFTDAQWQMARAAGDELPPVSSADFDALYRFQLSRTPIAFSKTWFTTESLVVAVLHTGAASASYSVKGTLEVVFPNGKHVPSEDLAMAASLGLCAVIMTVCGVVFALWNSLVALQPKSPSVTLLLMAVVCTIRATYMLLDRQAIQNLGVSGQEGELTQYCVALLLAKIADVLTILLFLLLSLGFPRPRPTITAHELRFLAAAVVISLYSDVFQLLSVDFFASEYLTRVIVSLVVIVATNFYAAATRSELLDHQLDMAASRLYFAFRAFDSFRWVFMAWFLKPSILLFIQASAFGKGDSSSKSCPQTVFLNAVFDVSVLLCAAYYSDATLQSPKRFFTALNLPGQ